MKVKKKYTLNRITMFNGLKTLVHWRCNVCSMVFGTMKQLKVHKREIHAH